MATEMDVSWEPVEQSAMNGILLGYEVSNKKDWKWNNTQVCFTFTLLMKKDWADMAEIAVTVSCSNRFPPSNQFDQPNNMAKSPLLKHPR